MGYQVFLGEQPQNFLANVDNKTDRIVRDNLGELAGEPYPHPDAGSSDGEN